MLTRVTSNLLESKLFNGLQISNMKPYSLAFDLSEPKAGLLLRLIRVIVGNVKCYLVKTATIEPDLTGSSGMSVSYVAPEIKPDIAPSKEKDFFFLLISTIDQQENLKILLKAFSSEKLKGRKLVVVIKEKSESFYVMEWVSSTNVTIINSFDEELVSYLYKKASVFVNCSSNGDSKPGVIEAISNNCLLVLSDIQAFKGITNEKTKYFDPASESSIIDAVLSV